MDILVPNGVTSITFATAGVKAVSNGRVTGISDEEATQVCASYNRPKVGNTVLASGDGEITLPPQITSITINGNVYAVTNGRAAAVKAADLTALFHQGWLMNGFRAAGQ